MYLNLKSDSVKSPLMLIQSWVITSPIKLSVWLYIHILIIVKLCSLKGLRWMPSSKFTCAGFALCCVSMYCWCRWIDSYPDSKVHGATWGPSGADRTQVGPMLAPWTLLSWYIVRKYFPRIEELTGAGERNLKSMDRHMASYQVVHSIMHINDCVWGPNWIYAVLGLGNGLAPKRRQSVTRTNDGPMNWPIYITKLRYGDMDR